MKKWQMRLVRKGEKKKKRKIKDKEKKKGNEKVSDDV